MKKIFQALHSLERAIVDYPAIVHHCHFPGCTVPTPRKWLYCKPHWFMVPAPIQQRVSAAYAALPHGPDGNCLRVSPEWIDATDEAQAAIKKSLNRRGTSMSKRATYCIICFRRLPPESGVQNVQAVHTES